MLRVLGGVSSSSSSDPTSLRRFRPRGGVLLAALSEAATKRTSLGVVAFSAVSLKQGRGPSSVHGDDDRVGSRTRSGDGSEVAEGFGRPAWALAPLVPSLSSSSPQLGGVSASHCAINTFNSAARFSRTHGGVRLMGHSSAVSLPYLLTLPGWILKTRQSSLIWSLATNSGSTRSVLKIGVSGALQR